MIPLSIFKAPTRLLAGLLSAPLVGLAAPQTGQLLPELKLKDQFEQPWSVVSGTKLVLFSSSRKASDMLQAVLGDQPKGFLASRQTVYLADMSRMPGLVTRMFALPALRKMPFSVGVVLDENLLADWPRQADAVTLIGLRNERVSSVTFATSDADVRTALGILP